MVKLRPGHRHVYCWFFPRHILDNSPQKYPVLTESIKLFLFTTLLYSLNENTIPNTSPVWIRLSTCTANQSRPPSSTPFSPPPPPACLRLVAGADVMTSLRNQCNKASGRTEPAWWRHRALSYQPIKAFISVRLKNCLKHVKKHTSELQTFRSPTR